jgi:hypothetical protein
MACPVRTGDAIAGFLAGFAGLEMWRKSGTIQGLPNF